MEGGKGHKTVELVGTHLDHGRKGGVVEGGQSLEGDHWLHALALMGKTEAGWGSKRVQWLLHLMTLKRGHGRKWRGSRDLPAVGAALCVFAPAIASAITKSYSREKACRRTYRWQRRCMGASSSRRRPCSRHHRRVPVVIARWSYV